MTPNVKLTRRGTGKLEIKPYYGRALVKRNVRHLFFTLISIILILQCRATIKLLPDLPGYWQRTSMVPADRTEPEPSALDTCA